MQNKLASYALVFFAAVSIIIIVAVVFYKNAQKNEVKKMANQSEEAIIESEVGTNGSNEKQLPKEIIAIKDNNVTGTIEKITVQSIDVKNIEDDSVQTFRLTGNTSVVSVENSKIESKHLSDLRLSDTIYLQYEKGSAEGAKNALTITIQ